MTIKKKKERVSQMNKTQKGRYTLKDRVRKELKENKLCKIALDELEDDIEVQTLLEDSNRMAIDRLGFSDHGHTHSLLVAMNGVKLVRALSTDLEPSIVQEGTGGLEDAELIVFLGCYLHDIGMVVARTNHDMFTVVLSIPILDRILAKVYPNDKHRQVHVRGHVLHAIYTHDMAAPPITVEAGIVGVADALDMTKGRARIPFEAGSVNIHSASAMAIEKVNIKRGEKKTVRIEVVMNNATGIFQIQELLEKKIRGSPQLLEHIELYAIMSGEADSIITAEELQVL